MLTINEEIEHNKDFETLKDNLTKKNINHSLNYSPRENSISVNKIIVPKENRQQGLGSEAMRSITDHADKHGKRITLSPSDDFGGNKKDWLGSIKGMDL